MKQREIETIKLSIADLTFGDEYLFETILLENIELTKLLIEKLTGIPDIEDIVHISTEETHKYTYRNKGVRFDVYVKSQTGVAYIVELQRIDTKEMPKRMRYYQVMSDSKQLPKGKVHNYKDLKDNYVILISREDIFGMGQYKYSFENMCHEIEGLKLNDGTHKIVYNTQGIKGEVCEDIKAFLDAIEGKPSDNLFVKQFEDAAEKIKADEKWREAYMQSLLRDQDKFDAGVEKGREEEKIEIAKNLLELGISVEDVAKGTGLSVEYLKKEILI